MEEHLRTETSKEIILAKILSYLFHPLFMPTFGMLLVFFSNQLNGFNLYAMPETMASNRIIFLIVVVFTMVIPGLAAVLLKRMGEIESLQMENRKDRLLPFAITGFCYLAASVVMQNTLEHVNPLIYIIMTGALVAILLALIISVYWKVSIHMIGIGGIVGTEILMMSYFHFSWDLVFYSTLFIAGLVGFARLRLSAHEPLQVLAGFLIGVFTESFFLLFY